MAFAIGPVSGCHLNPSVTAAVWASGRMSTSDAIGYIIAQMIGGIIGAAILYIIMKGQERGLRRRHARSRPERLVELQPGFGDALPSSSARLIFTLVILAVTGTKGGTPMAGLIIGLTLMVMHFAFIPVSGSSLNGARSLRPRGLRRRYGAGAGLDVSAWCRPSPARSPAGWSSRRRSTSRATASQTCETPVSLARGRGFSF